MRLRFDASVLAPRVRLVTVGLVFVALVACSRGGPEYSTVRSVPDDSRVLATTTEETTSWTMSRGQDGCLWLTTTIVDRASISGPFCPNPFNRGVLRVTDPCVRFTDRPVRLPDCSDSGDCAAPPCDASTLSRVVWGQLPPEAAFACATVGGSPTVLRPVEASFILSAIPGDGTNDEGLEQIDQFTVDGRPVVFSDAPPPTGGRIQACQAAGAPGASPPQPLSWPLRIEIDPTLDGRRDGLALRTPTGNGFGFAFTAFNPGPDGTLASDTRIFLYSDMTTITAIPISESGAPGGPPQILELPQAVLDGVRRRLPCARVPLLVRVHAVGTVEATTGEAGGC